MLSTPPPVFVIVDFVVKLGNSHEIQTWLFLILWIMSQSLAGVEEKVGFCVSVLVY